MMDWRIAIGATLAVIGIGIAIYEWLGPKPPLPPPLADERDKLAEWWKFWKETRKG
jgi:hypothetical protein